MQLVFVHGWSVTNSNTYAQMPQAISAAASQAGLDIDIRHVYLGRYISFHDEVTLDDIARAMDNALRDLPGNSESMIKPFSCITHSTGGPVVRHWVDRFYGKEKLKKLPLDHLIMLAPANHGSALARLGKARVGRIKAWFSGVEPGQRVLDWLSLGSDGQWALNENYLDYDYTGSGFYPFVLTGQGIDHKFYDFLNSYLVEPGSDGVVRVAGANMNYRYFSLVQSQNKVVRKKPLTYSLAPSEAMRSPQAVPLGVYKGYSHSGSKMGIMGSIKSGDIRDPIIHDIVKCLRVKSASDYQLRAGELISLTQQQQSNESKFCMLIFNVCDDQGERIKEDDYDLYLLAGNRYRPNDLPKHFFKDRQMNQKTGRLVYYLNIDKMKKIKDGKFGIRVIARPNKGFSYYHAAEFHSDGLLFSDLVNANETVYIDVILHRFVDENVFRFDPASKGAVNFKRIKPSGKPLNNK